MANTEVRQRNHQADYPGPVAPARQQFQKYRADHPADDAQHEQINKRTLGARTPLDAMTDWLLPLVEAGVDILRSSQRRFWEPEFAEIDGANGLNFAGWAKKLTGAATISVGSAGLSGDFMAAFGGSSSTPVGLDNLIQRMERGEFDLIAVGRALLSDRKPNGATLRWPRFIGWQKPVRLTAKASDRKPVTRRARPSRR